MNVNVKRPASPLSSGAGSAPGDYASIYTIIALTPLELVKSTISLNNRILRVKSHYSS
jgi:hypothetical protein